MVNRTSRAATGQIRIIGGQWRGRKLPVLTFPGLRPTPDRVRETVFNWLAPVIADARCLDCFAGSGALGLEALSRYARQATLIERERQVARQLTQNIARLGTDNAVVIQHDTLQWLAQPGSPFDIVFVDPPFRQGLADRCLVLLEQQGWLADEAWIYLETELEAAVSAPVNWSLYREKPAGQLISRLYFRQSTQSHGGELL